MEKIKDSSDYVQDKADAMREQAKAKMPAAGMLTKKQLKKAVYNNVHQIITLISPLTAGLLNVIKVAPEVIETKCF